MFPTDLVDLPNPDPRAPTNSPVTPLSGCIANLNAVVEGLQAKVGIDGSAVAGSIDARLADVKDAAEAAQSSADSAQQTADAAAPAIHTHTIAQVSGLIDADYMALINPRPKRLRPIDAVPHNVSCEALGAAWGYSGSDTQQLIRVNLTNRAVTNGYRFPSGESIVHVFAGIACLLVLTKVVATDKHYLYRTTSGASVTLVHNVGQYLGTHYAGVSLLDRGLSSGLINSQPALILATYNYASEATVAAGDPADLNYIAISYDDGVTWQIVNVWNQGSHTIRHFHAVRYDQYREKWWFCVGDSPTLSMVFTWDGQASWPGNLGNAALSAVQGFEVGYGESNWRAVDVLITPDHVETFTDTVGGTTGGIWRMNPDLSKMRRISHLNLGKQHDGWTSILCADGTQLWCDDCRDDTSTNAQRHLSVYAAAPGGRYYDIAKVALTGTGVVVMKGFFEASDGNIWISSAQVAGKGNQETTVLERYGKFREERPDAVAPAYFVNFSTGSDSNSGKTSGAAWKTAAKCLASNNVTYGARVMLSAGSSTENGVATIDYAANSAGATDTALPVQISGQGRDVTIITLSGATAGWRDSSAAKTWNIELSDLTLTQSNNTQSILWDTAPQTTPGKWTVRDATIGDQVVGGNRNIYVRTATVNGIRSRIKSPKSASQYCVYADGSSTVTLEACVLEGGRNIQLSNANVSLKQCSIVRFAGTGILINSGATVAPTIKNCLFDYSDQSPISNAAGLDLSATVINCAYNLAPGVNVPSSPLGVSDGFMVSPTPDFVPESVSPLVQLAESLGVVWDLYGNAFRKIPTIGAVEAQW